MNYTVLSTNIIIWAVFAGIILASICITFQKRAISCFINALNDNNCINDKQTAKSLRDLGIDGKIKPKIILSALKVQTGLRRIVCVVKPDDSVVKLIDRPHTPAVQDKFFLCDDDIEEILKKYTHQKSNPLAIAVLVIILLVVAFFATYVTPWLTNYANNAIDSFSDDTSSSTEGVREDQLSQEEIAENKEENTENSDETDSDENNTDSETLSDNEQSNEQYESQKSSVEEPMEINTSNNTVIQ